MARAILCETREMSNPLISCTFSFHSGVSTIAVNLSDTVIFIRTGHNVACYGISTVTSIEDGLNTVGVLSTRSQAQNVNASRVRCLLSRRLAILAGEDGQLGERSRRAEFRNLSLNHIKDIKSTSCLWLCGATHRAVNTKFKFFIWYGWHVDQAVQHLHI